MPTKHAAFKHIRQAKKRTERNRRVKTALHGLVKRSRKALEAKDRPTAEGAIRTALRAIDRAAARGIIKPNTAARKKSRLMRRLNALSRQPGA